MKILVGVDIGSYSFDAANRTITLTGMNNIKLEQLLLITNIRTAAVIYQFNNNSLHATITNNVITLQYDTSMCFDSDALQIFVEYENINQNKSNLNEYTQLDLLNLMYEELQAQTKILKKIYQ